MPDLASRLLAACTLHGSFRLRSGQTASVYLDKYAFESDPNLLFEVAGALQLLLPLGTELLAGLELGGVPIATALSWITWLPQVFVRKAPKPYGTCRLVEGPEVAGKRLVLIEDVVTTGGQVIASARALRDLGAMVEDVLCVVERGTAGRDNLARVGLRLNSLVSWEEA